MTSYCLFIDNNRGDQQTFRNLPSKTEEEQRFGSLCTWYPKLMLAVKLRQKTPTRLYQDKKEFSGDDFYRFQHL